jgi:hypothetical protein
MASSFAGCPEVNDIAAATVAIAATAAIPGVTQSVAFRPRFVPSSSEPCVV